MRNSKTKGFTLIELIVVMAIIGVLAAILVPSMIGYLNDSKYSKANANAKQVYQSTANWCTKCEVNSSPVTCEDLQNADLRKSLGEPTYNGADNTDLQAALVVYMGGTSKAGECNVALSNSAPAGAQWRGKNDAGNEDPIFGEFPAERNATSENGWGTFIETASADNGNNDNK